ncbi:MAG TPA: DUF1232 domain-containing protein [Cyclobacteriaceae bacterium]
MNIKNIRISSFFKRASNLASVVVSNRLRLITLLGAVGKKLNEVNDKQRRAQEVKEMIFLFGRLLKATVYGQYKVLPWKSALSIAASLVYFLNPADIIPDIVPISGFLDDFTIIVWTYNSLFMELQEFKKWEAANQSQE